MRKMVHVDTAGGNIRSDQYTGGMVLKISQCTLAGCLALVSMDSFRSDIRFCQNTGHFVRPMFRTGEYQYRFQRRIF